MYNCMIIILISSDTRQYKIILVSRGEKNLFVVIDLRIQFLEIFSFLSPTLVRINVKKWKWYYSLIKKYKVVRV